MEVGVTVKSKNTGKLYTVIEQKENHEGFTTEDENGDTYYMFESEVDIIQSGTSNSSQANSEEIANAILIIENDLLSCRDVMELGTKYKSYSEMLTSFMLKAIDKL